MSNKTHSTLEKEIGMSEQTPTTDEERKINRRSFIIGIFIVLAIFILYTILYYAGLFG
ncbi:MAG: hypothetical protein ACJ8AG_28625 [Ktedonobacteraceae bacterium]